MRHALASLAVVAATWLLQHARSQWKERSAQRIQQDRLPASNPERVALAETIGADGVPLLSAVADGAAPAWLREGPALQTRRRVWIQQFSAPNGPARWRSNEDRPPAAVLSQSPYAVQARFGLKRTTTWTGYKVPRTETCEPDQPHLITGVQPTDAPVPDAPVPDTELLDPLHTHLAERARLPAEQLVAAGDVDAGVLVTAAAAHRVDVLGPVRADTHGPARHGQGFAAACFVMAWAAKSVVCPPGMRSVTWQERVDHLGRDVIASACGGADGKRCPLRGAWTQKTHGARTRKLLPKAHCLALYAARQRQQPPDFREQYVQRAGIEGTLSQGVRRSTLRRSRSIGLARTPLQHLLTATAATALNLLRAVAWLGKTPRATTRPSRFAALLTAG